jgi:hypothetical protein
MKFTRFLLVSSLAILAPFAAFAQSAPSPTFNNVTVNGQLNSKALPSSAFVGTTDTRR